ncbi:MAG: segregation/condensation protein A [Clostridia bacterium]
MKEIILNNKSDYNVVTNNFEGPLDLLLFLICKNKMNIFDISLSNLTDEYINYLNTMNELNLDIASDFIVMAATLLSIKAKKLLPELDEKEEDEISEEEMISRIIEYKKYKEIAVTINNLYSTNFGTFNKNMEKIKFKKNTEYTGDKINVQQIFNTYNDILFRNIRKINVKSKEIEKLAIYEKITVKDKAKQIINYLVNNESLNFSTMFNVDKVNNLEIVTAFLGTLELSKIKQVCINQEEVFADIYITKNDRFNISYDLSKVVE